MFKGKKDFIFNVIIVLLWGALTLFFAMHHEIWRDEAQAWLVVRDLDLAGIIRHVRTEGHPLLWYFLLFPLAKLHLGVLSMQVLNWLLIFAGGVFFVFKSPFNKFVKSAFLFGSGMFYLLPSFSRSYSLIPILIFILAYFYPKRRTNPYIYALLLILIANTHVIMFGFVSSLCLLYLYELVTEKDSANKKAVTISLTAAALSLLAIVLYLSGVRAEHIYVSVYETTTLAVFNSWAAYLSGISLGWFTVLFYLAALGAFGFLLKRSPKMFFVFTTSVISQFIIYRWIWRFLPQRAFTILLILMFCLWVVLASKEFSAKEKLVNNIFTSIFAVVFFLSTFTPGIKFILMDLRMEYSDSKNAAQFINENIPSDAVIVSTYDLITSGILAYLPERKFYSAEYETFYTYSLWTMTKQDSMKGLTLPNTLWKNDELYILSSPSITFNGAELVYASKQGIISEYERFVIYRLRKN